MISDVSAIVFVVALAAIVCFSTWVLKYRINLLLPKIYLAISTAYSLWVIAVLIMKYIPAEKGTALWVLDAVTNISSNVMPVLYMLLAFAFCRNWNKIPSKAWLLFILPIISICIIWTNPIHHLYYTNFSVIREEVAFGPWFYVSTVYDYGCLIVGVIYMTWFIISSKSKLVVRQGFMYILGILSPIIMSVVATLGLIKVSIAATPLSFALALLFHGIAIYQLHIIDVQPIAIQKVMDEITDCYLILSEKTVVSSMNKQFKEIFGNPYGITENCYLNELDTRSVSSGKSPVPDILNALTTCKQSKSRVTFEQTVTHSTEEGMKRHSYIAEVSPVFSQDESIIGFVCIFKDITALRNSMQQLENQRNRMVESERLAFLGSMVGGIAHNLKTPIMSISGGVIAVENLIEECKQSIDDPEVTKDDYLEIYEEMDAWADRIKDSCTYMSDIITAIKGQAANANTNEEITFTVNDMMRRVVLLMRHELISGKCHLTNETNVTEDIILHGDVNNLIQVLNNLISNAIFAMKPDGGVITIGVQREEEVLKIYVKDTGKGVEPKVKEKLFREMITSKGTQGTGLGLYISNSVIKGKFGGSLWVDDNPEGGAIFGFSIPIENVEFREITKAAVKEGQE